MNRWKQNSNKIVKKERIRKLRGLERRAVAVATAASFALMLSSCEELELPSQTTQGGAQTQTRISEASTAWAEVTSDLPFEPPVSNPADTSEPEVTAPPPEENKDNNMEIPSAPDEGDDVVSSEVPEETEPSISDPDPEPEPEPDIDDDTEVEPVVEVRTSIHFEAIPFRTVYVNDPNMYDDETVVQNEGKEGSVKITVYSTYIDGVLDSSRSQRETLSFSQDRVIKRGTKPSVTTEEKTVKETVEKYSTIYEECDTMEIGTTQIKTEGKDSVATRTYRYTYTRGVLTSRELISESISERVDEVVLVGTKEPVKDTTFGMPFIDAAHGGVNYSVTQYFSSSHNALDFGVYYGDPIVAAMSGTVIAAYDEGYFSTDNILWTYGTYVVIQHDGYRTYYAHLSSRTVSVGDTVQKGQVIGYSGNTGRVNSSAGGPYAGTHLHFEIRKYYSSLGVYHTVDPTLYLPWWN